MKRKSRTKTASCKPKDSQYTARQVVYCVMIPDSRRARRTPNTSPDMTIEIIVDRCFAGAYWTASGNMNCGVQVSSPMTNERPRKVLKELVNVAPSH